MKKISDEELIDEIKKRFHVDQETLVEIRDLTKQLKLVNQKLEESESLKTHFISNITNEIINPFASILGLANNILNVGEGDMDKVKAMARLIYTEAFNLDFQLRNIFMAAELESGEIQPQIANVDIDQVFRALIDEYTHEIHKKNIEVKYSFNKNGRESSYFKIDPEKFKLILTNLFSNALKFSYSYNKIEITVWFEEDNLKFTVKDYGRGISQANQRIIFDRFKRLDSGINSLNRGHGLGLSITKALIDLLEGSIEITSTEKEGALFTISFPCTYNDQDITDMATDGNEIFFSDDEIF